MMPKLNLSGRLNAVFIAAQRVILCQQKVQKLPMNVIEIF